MKSLLSKFILRLVLASVISMSFYSNAQAIPVPVAPSEFFSVEAMTERLHKIGLTEKQFTKIVRGLLIDGSKEAFNIVWYVTGFYFIANGATKFIDGAVSMYSEGGYFLNVAPGAYIPFGQLANLENVDALEAQARAEGRVPSEFEIYKAAYPDYWKQLSGILEVDLGVLQLVSFGRAAGALTKTKSVVTTVRAGGVSAAAPGALKQVIKAASWNAIAIINYELSTRKHTGVPSYPNGLSAADIARFLSTQITLLITGRENNPTTRAIKYLAQKTTVLAGAAVRKVHDLKKKYAPEEPDQE